MQVKIEPDKFFEHKEKSAVPIELKGASDGSRNGVGVELSTPEKNTPTVVTRPIDNDHNNNCLPKDSCTIITQIEQPGKSTAPDQESAPPSSGLYRKVVARLEVVLLVVVVAIAWGLLTLPIVFNYIPSVSCLTCH